MSRKKRIQLRQETKATKRAAKVARTTTTTTFHQKESIESCLAALQALQQQQQQQPEEQHEQQSTLEESTTGETRALALIAPIPPSLASRAKDKILNWNQALSLWLHSGTYTTTLLPPFEVEVARHFKVQALSTFLLEACPELKMPAFERWLLDARTTESGVGDPVLSTTHYQDPASQRLVQEIVETKGMVRKKAQRVVGDLCRKNTVALRELAELTAAAQVRAPFKKGDRVVLERKTPESWTLVYHRNKWAKPFCVSLNAQHYEKLKTQFFRVHHLGDHAPGDTVPAVLHVFHALVMCLLTRYSSLSGGHLLMDLRGGGMQGAIHGAVFDVLQRFFPKEPCYEGFGSPMNCCLPSFGSAFFEDLDWHFGSMGNFLDLPFERGIVEANPPFAPGVMEQMAHHMDHCLAQSTQPLAFCVIVPDAGDASQQQRSVVKKHGAQSLTHMLNSPFLGHHILLRAKEHGYIEGAQHMRPTKYKESLYDTRVILLHNQAAAKGLEYAKLEEELRTAFVSLHRAEVEKRKQEKKDAAAEKS